jgi:hypothetical protein
MTNLHAKYEGYICGSKESKVIGRTRKNQWTAGGQTDKLIPVYPLYNFVVQGYNYETEKMPLFNFFYYF